MLVVHCFCFCRFDVYLVYLSQLSSFLIFLLPMLMSVFLFHFHFYFYFQLAHAACPFHRTHLVTLHYTHEQWLKEKSPS